MCQERQFEPQAAIRALHEEVAQLTDLVTRLEAQLATSGGASARPAGDTRALVPPADPEPLEGGEVSDDHPRVKEMVDAAPASMREKIRRFARSVVTDGEVARKQRPPRTAAHKSRVVGGLPVPPGSFLSCVCLGIPNWGCTGVVVAPRVVLTAAHCGHAITRIMVGGTTVLPLMSEGARLIEIADVVVHPQYAAAPQSKNDITVLILKSPAQVPPVRLAVADEIRAAQAFDVVGFGNDDPNSTKGFGTKRRATIPYAATMQRPGEDLGNLPNVLGFHPEYEFVSGRKYLAIDSCNGDSGGPIYIQAGGAFNLAGLTSRATVTAQASCGDGGIYVRPEPFREWIADVAARAGVEPLPN